MSEPTAIGSVVYTRMRWDTHRADTDRVWVRMANHEIAPWVSTDDLGNVICMGWEQLVEPDLTTPPRGDRMSRRPSDAQLSLVIAALFLIGWLATDYAMHALGGT